MTQDPSQITTLNVKPPIMILKIPHIVVQNQHHVKILPCIPRPPFASPTIQSIGIHIATALNSCMRPQLSTFGWPPYYNIMALAPDALYKFLKSNKWWGGHINSMWIKFMLCFGVMSGYNKGSLFRCNSCSWWAARTLICLKALGPWTLEAVGVDMWSWKALGITQHWQCKHFIISLYKICNRI